MRRRCGWCGVRLRWWQVNACQVCGFALAWRGQPPCQSASRWNDEPDRWFGPRPKSFTPGAFR